MEKKEKIDFTKTTEVVYYDNYVKDDAVEDEIVKGQCDAMDEPVPDRGSDEFQRILDDYDEVTCDDFRGQFPDLGRCLVTGQTERWNGTFDGGTVMKVQKPESFSGLLKDCDYQKFFSDKDGFHVQGTHHDGTVFFTVRPLNSEGIDLYDEWYNGEGEFSELSEREIHEKLSEGKYSEKMDYYLF